MSAIHQASEARYEVRVRGELDPSWGSCFPGMAIALLPAGDEPPITTLTGIISDQPALRGVLCRLWDLNLTLVSLRRLETDTLLNEESRE